MRQSLRLLASVKPVAARYLEAGAPTGLTGLLTNPSPRSTLLYLYSTTLDKLQAVPETSVYRQSVEAVTKHRMSLVETVKPEGYDEWKAKALEILEKHPKHFKAVSRLTGEGSTAAGVERAGKFFVVKRTKPEVDERYQEWDGEWGGESISEDEAEFVGTLRLKDNKPVLVLDTHRGDDVEWVNEPSLTVDQIGELENKIGAGLIEEVIQVAEGELHLADTMVQSKVWESLEEKPAEGQWKYFERKD